MSRYVNAKGTGRSSGTRVLLRMTGGFLSVCLNVVIYVVLIYFLIKAVNISYDYAYVCFCFIRVIFDIPWLSLLYQQKGKRKKTRN